MKARHTIIARYSVSWFHLLRRCDSTARRADFGEFSRAVVFTLVFVLTGIAIGADASPHLGDEQAHRILDAGGVRGELYSFSFAYGSASGIQDKKGR